MTLFVIFIIAPYSYIHILRHIFAYIYWGSTTFCRKHRIKFIIVYVLSFIKIFRFWAINIFFLFLPLIYIILLDFPCLADIVFCWPITSSGTLFVDSLNHIVDLKLLNPDLIVIPTRIYIRAQLACCPNIRKRAKPNFHAYQNIDLNVIDNLAITHYFDVEVWFPVFFLKYLLPISGFSKSSKY